MKLLGLIGGMSWENTIDYYKIVNQLVNEQLGGWSSAELLLYSVNFKKILTLQKQDKWKELGVRMIDIAQRLQNSGSKALIICSNTMHKVAHQIEKQISIPLIHVVDATLKEIHKNKIQTIGLLGTKFTMESKFYVNRLKQKGDIEALLPSSGERDFIHKAIYNELAKGKFLDSTKQEFLKIIESLRIKGAEGIILGCTELPLLIKQNDVNIPLFDTLRIHLSEAVEFALSE